MASDRMELREILESNIGQVYKDALAALGDPAAAKDVTRRVMALLKRTYDAGLSVTPDTVKRLTADCCTEQASYSKKASFRDGVIADMPDFDTALASVEGEKSSAAEEAPRRSLKTAGVAKRAPLPYSDDDDDDYPDDEDDEDYDEDYEDYDEDYEPLFEKKPRQPVLPLIGLWVLVVVLAALAFCLMVMLMERNVLPGGSSRFVQQFTAWFNSSLFPLF